MKLAARVLAESKSPLFPKLILASSTGTSLGVALFGAARHLVPAALPFFSPRKGTSTDHTVLLGQVLLAPPALLFIRSLPTFISPFTEER